MKLSDLYNSFLLDKLSYCAPASIRYYRGALDLWFSWLDARNVSLFQEVTPEVLKYYLLYLRGRTCKGTTIRNYFRAIYSFLNYCSYEFDLPVIKKIQLPKNDPEIILPLSQDEGFRLLSSCRSNRDKAIVKLMLDYGLRSSEVRNLNLGDVSSAGIIIRNSKYNKSRVLPVNSDLLELLDSVPKVDSPALLNSSCGCRMSEDAVKCMFQKLKSDSGIQRVHAHLLRHTFATSYMVNFGNLEYLRLYLGHESYDVTQQYISLSSQALLSAFDIYKIPPVFKK
ncbi:MAG: tyrosine-type recombinase/integrase [Treponema sp.]|nr:tyrosine-type recombinase/integrase [Treponema sp.]